LEDLIVAAASLKYHEMPNYHNLRKILHDYAAQAGIELDNKYDWDELIHEGMTGSIILK
jgi:hypothetical protein